MTPKIIRPLRPEIFSDLQNHVSEVRRLFDWPGIPYHDEKEPAGGQNRFNRWFWHNLPLLRTIHHSPSFIELACETFDRLVKPSYVFLSMYGPEGICPFHSDRPQCQYTIDLLIDYVGEEPWPIRIEDLYLSQKHKNSRQRELPPDHESFDPAIYRDYALQKGEAVCYSGTGQKHFRKSGSEVGLVKADLAFFHFVPVEWQGCCE